MPDRDKVKATGRVADTGYAAWKRGKIEQGLAESRDRSVMITIEHVWRDLKLES